MNTQTQQETREAWIARRALNLVRSQGYSEETGYGFAAYAIEHCPEVQGFQNLFDCYMNQQD